MNTCKLLVSVWMFVSVLLSACAPVAIATQPAPTAMPAVPTANLAPKNTAEIAATIPLEFGGDKVMVGTGAVWVSHGDNGLVTRIDPATNTVVAQIKVGDPTFDFYHLVPAGIAIVGDQVWATITTSLGEGELVRIDPATNEVVEHIPMGDLQYPNGTLPFSPWSIASDGDTLWVSDFLHNGIARVDTQTKQITAKILNVEHVLSIVPDTDAVWVSSHREDSLVRIDPKTNSVVATIPLFPGGKGPDILCGWCIGTVAIGDGSVWVTLGNGNGIARIDLTTNQVVAKIDLEGAVDIVFGQGGLWVTVSPDDCDNGRGYLAQIDPKTNTVVEKISLNCPGSIAIDADALWVSTTTNTNAYALVKIQLNPVQ